MSHHDAGGLFAVRAGRVDIHEPEQGSSGRRVPMPVRKRVVQRARLITFAGLLVVVGLTLGLSWVIARSVASDSYLWLDLVHVAAFVALALVAYLFARHSTGVIEELFEREDRLMMAAVHEGNRPLSRLVASVDEGLAGTVPPDAALKDVSVHAEHLSEILRALVEAARVATGAIPLADEVVRLDEVAASVASTGAAETATLTWHMQPVLLRGSPRLLRLGIANLVRNAARHAYHGGPGEIHVRVDETGVAVSDHGPGIGDARLAELCQRDGRWWGTNLTKVSLGLTITGWLAEVHGGKMRLVNRPQGGLEARLELPVTPTTTPEVVEASRPTPRDGEAIVG